MEMRQDRENCFSIIRERLLELIRNIFRITSFFFVHVVTFTCLVPIIVLRYVTIEDLLMVLKSDKWITDNNWNG